VRELFIKQLN